MKTVSAGLGTHLAGETTTLATCWKCTRTDGVVFGFCDHDRDLVVPAGSPTGQTYSAATGYTRSAIQTSDALNVDNLDLEGAFDAAGITEADLRAGLWDYATVEIFQVNWADLTLGTLKLRKGTLGQIKAGRYAFNTELRGLTQHLQQSAGRLYGPMCDADLGDSRCGVHLTGSPSSPYVVTGAVTSVTSARVFADTSRTEAAGYFDFGLITWVTGLNAGLSMEVKTFTQGSPLPGDIALQLPMPYAVAIGDTYSMSAGCDKKKATCISKFNNLANFRGFPDVPGSDLVMGGGING